MKPKEIFAELGIGPAYRQNSAENESPQQVADRVTAATSNVVIQLAAKVLELQRRVQALERGERPSLLQRCAAKLGLS